VSLLVLSLAALVLLVAWSSPGDGWAAQWIWPRGPRKPNAWMCFRRRFRLPARPTAAAARIAVDSKYWLWVNGELAVREGGLRRGPTPNGTYFDQIDLGRYLQAGENLIAVLLWYWGREGFSHKDSGAGGLLFEMAAQTGAGEKLIVSDAAWRARPHPAFLPAGAPNYRLPEWSIRFDARRDEPGWEQPGFDDRAWAKAVEKAPAGGGPWGELEPRPVPQWKDYGLRPYRSVAISRAGVFTCKLPYNMQLNAYLSVKAPAGKRIRIETDHSYLGPLEWTYVTRDGAQQWECPWWGNGEEVRYKIPEGVEVVDLRYRETGIGAEFAGMFRCEDDALNVLWKKSRRTTYVCVRDNYMDCPDRERAQWWGDAVNEVLQTFYAFSPAAHAHARKGMLEVARWQRPGGVLYSPVPSGNFNQELPCQMLAGVWGMWQYYLYTGDRQAVEIVYPHARRYLALWQQRKDARGFVVPRGEWVWIDWGKRQDGYRIANALYVIALDSAIAMAELIGRRADVPRLRRWRNEIANRFAVEMWSGRGFGLDDRANALAVLAGLVRDDQKPAVKRLLMRTQNASPYMERYVEEALLELGDAAAALARMRRRYGQMVRHPCTTLWEGWSWRAGEKASNNHAWAGGPLYLLSAYVAGVRPLEPGFRRCLVAPMLGGLGSIDCVVPTVRGPIELRICDDKGVFAMDLALPDRCPGRVGLPKGRRRYKRIVVDGLSAWPRPGGKLRGATFESADDRFVWLLLEPGRHRIRGRR